jgi:2'-5' RNA ligase
MIRLFVALDLDTGSRSLLSRLAQSIPGARPVVEEQLHLTIRFIGEVDGGLYHDIRENLGTVKAAPIRLAVKGVGHFPPRGKPRVIWAGVEPAGDIIILRNKVNRALLECGVALETRKFHPHITLARLNNVPAGKIVHFLTGNSLLQSPPVVINTLTLYSSNLTPRGALHTIEAEYLLDAT